MAEPEPGPPLIYSIKLELLGYLDSDTVVAGKSERRIKPFILERP